MAMCFSLLCLGQVPVTINDPAVSPRLSLIILTASTKLFPMSQSSLNTIPVIAIDGPSASGKGTIAQLVAQRLGYHYLDSGALYRIVALAALRKILPGKMKLPWQN